MYITLPVHTLLYHCNYKQTDNSFDHWNFYTPNFEEVGGAYYIWVVCLFVTIFDASRMSHVTRKPVFAYANNKGADQLVHPHSLISAFVVRCLDSIVPLLAIAETSRP